MMQKTSDELRDSFFKLKSPNDVAQLLDVGYERLVWHIYRSPTSKRCTVFSIPKKSGGDRPILAPITALKLLQQKLNQVLQQVYEPKPSVHGFIYKRCIVSNAKLHSGRRFVFNVDLESFFPSINFGRVRGMFIAPPYNLDPSVATVLAQICCHNNQLPQGAPTSPIVSNMICAKLDSELQHLAGTNKCVYSRYADDLTFSTSASRFPKAIAILESQELAGEAAVGFALKQVIQSNGFRINENKVRF